MPANSTVSVIREVVNERLNNYESHLTVQSAPGLMTDDPLFLIDTDNSHRLLDLMEVMPDGRSIGLAGPRGCGKTTLLRESCTGELRLSGNRRPTAIMVTAPIEFTPRDFLLHLFAQICHAALRDEPLPRSVGTRSRAGGGRDFSGGTSEPRRCLVSSA